MEAEHHQAIKINQLTNQSICFLLAGPHSQDGVGATSGGSAIVGSASAAQLPGAAGHCVISALALSTGGRRVHGPTAAQRTGGLTERGLAQAWLWRGGR